MWACHGCPKDHLSSREDCNNYFAGLQFIDRLFQLVVCNDTRRKSTLVRFANRIANALKSRRPPP